MPDRDPAEMLAHARDESRLSSTAARQIASRYTWDAAVAAIERAMGEVAPR